MADVVALECSLTLSPRALETSCLRLKLVELNFLVSFNTDDQSKTDVVFQSNAINVITYD